MRFFRWCPPRRRIDPVEVVRKQITEKVERVKAGVQKWAASVHDPSPILKWKFIKGNS
jgi:hypothetical protein